MDELPEYDRDNEFEDFWPRLDRRLYEDFVPPHAMAREPAVHTLTVDLSGAGYKKEHVTTGAWSSAASAPSSSTTGAASAHGKKFRRNSKRQIQNSCLPVGQVTSGIFDLPVNKTLFRVEVAIPDGCDPKGVHARFEKGVLRVTMPELPQETAPPAKSTATTAAAAHAQDRKDVSAAAAQQDGDRVPPQEEEEEKEEHEARKQQGKLRRASSAKDDAHGESAGVEGEVAAGSPSRCGYAFVHDRRKMATTMLGVALVLISFGIYVKYSRRWP
ncbi:hypothetical protein ACP70R_019148 [Stipagrostis hirtigluma subsp. patula]